MSEPYTYTDREGDKLAIWSSGTQGEAVVSTPRRGAVYISAADLPKIVAEMYRATGQAPLVVHEHVDDEGAGLSIKSSEYRPNVAFVEGCNGAYVTSGDLPGLVAKLYEATGQKPPIILPRYGSDATMTRHGKVRPMLMPSGEDMEVTEARDLASWYATAADLAEAEVEPSVADLASVMRVADPWLPQDAAEAAARAILRAGYVKTGGAA